MNTCREREREAARQRQRGLNNLFSERGREREMWGETKLETLKLLIE